MTLMILYLFSELTDEGNIHIKKCLGEIKKDALVKFVDYVLLLIYYIT